ncbi:MAG: C25 family cysteine peptidase, partial [Acidobacteriota bacterium]|nr:C25 family cysteine peptidase [Acidobacteriota bacterium]
MTAKIRTLGSVLAVLTTVVSVLLASSVAVAGSATNVVDGLSLAASARSSSIASLEAFTESGAVTVRFTTSELGGTVGFILYRFDESVGTWVQVNTDLLPAALGAAQGGVYELRDEIAASDSQLIYAVVEVGADGSETVSGPYRTKLSTRGSGEALLESSRGAGRDKVSSKSTGSRVVTETGARGGKGTGGGRLRIETTEAGLYLVSITDIARAFNMKAQRLRSVMRRGGLRLSSAAGEVAWHAAEEGLGLLFYSAEPTSPYAAKNVYWLEPGRGRTMVAVDGGAPLAGPRTSSPTTRRFEVDEMPVTSVSGAPTDDFWFWSYISAGHAVYGSSVHEFTVDDATVFSGMATIEVELQGATSTAANPDHRADFRINGVSVGFGTWDGAVAHRSTVTFPAAILRAGANELQVTGVRQQGVPYSVFLVDGFDMTCERAHEAKAGQVDFLSTSTARITMGGFPSSDVTLLDITDEFAPGAVSNLTASTSAGTFALSFNPSSSDRRYMAISGEAVRTPERIDVVADPGLTAETEGAEYVVISPAALSLAADDLAAYRRGAGLSALTVDVEAIYDEYGAGLPTPDAIRSYLLHAFASWRVAPRFVALAGAGSFDYRDLQGFGGNLLPPFMVSTPYGIYASDVPYADLAGDDDLPEIAVGRIPATSNDELQGYVDKLRAYEGFATGVEPDDVLLLADNADRAGNYPLDS